MALFSFSAKAKTTENLHDDGLLKSFVEGYSLEVLPRTAAKIDCFSDIIPAGTRVYIAHIEGTPFEDMLSTARRLREEGFAVMPHFPARIIRSKNELTEWVTRYQAEAGVDEALLLGGGRNNAAGPYSDSMQLVESGLFDNFKRLHFAGHPEGNRDIDADGGDTELMKALRWKQAFADDASAEVALVTQFGFAADPFINWIDKLAAEGIRLPVHVGVAGPAKLQTLLKYSLACGVGPSLRVLQRRAKDVTKLMLPYEPTDVLSELAAHKAAYPDFGCAQVHFFPLGGINASARWATENGGAANQPANSAE